MTDEERQRLTQLCADRQGRVCAHCGKPLDQSAIHLQLAHVVRRGRIRRLLGARYEWHPTFLAAVCSRRGNACNDAVMLTQGSKAELALIAAVKEEG